MTIGVLLLAAGQSRRFGTDKRKARVGGTSMLDATLDQIAVASLPCLVCLRDNDTDWSAQLAPRDGVKIVPCAPGGMGDSLASGIRALPDDWQGVLVAMGDMPFVLPSTYLAIAAATDCDTIVVPHVDGRRGNPVGFGRRYFLSLTQLRGDSGARDLTNADDVVRRDLPLADPGILQDVDTPACLQAIEG